MRRRSEFRSKFYWRPSLRRLGVRAHTYDYLEVNSDAYHDYTLLPHLNKTFACALALIDCLLFVGMLNSQNSLLTENVVYVCFYIFLCRAYQLAGTFFIDRVIFEREEKDKQHQPNIVTACCQLCSLWCFIVSILHFLSCFNVAYSIANQGIGIQTYGLQLSFVILMCVMEAARHAVVFWTVLNGLFADTFMQAAKIIFTVDCALRIMFAVIASTIVSSHLGAQNNILVQFLMQRI